MLVEGELEFLQFMHVCVGEARANGAVSEVVDTDVIGLLEILNTGQDAQIMSDTLPWQIEQIRHPISMDGYEW